MEQVERFDTNQRLQFINTKEQVNTDVSMNLPRKPQNVLLVCSKINDRFFLPCINQNYNNKFLLVFEAFLSTFLVFFF